MPCPGPRLNPSTLFTDLINSQKALLTATADGAEIPAAKQWTDALTSFTKWQMDSWNQLTGQWAAMFGIGTVLRADQGSPVLRRGLDQRPDDRSSRARVSGAGGSADQGAGSVPARRTQQGAVEFRAASVTDALSPANNLMTNPEAQQLALETGGKSLTEGLKLFTEDLAKGRISMTDESAFEVGENVATTPGTRRLRERDHPADPVHTQHRRGL